MGPDFPILRVSIKSRLHGLLRWEAVRVLVLVPEIVRACLPVWFRVCLLVLVGMPGCGATKSFTATEQLLMSDAVDSTISKLDFRPLGMQKVFLDTTYAAAAGKVIPGVPLPANLVTSDYVISAIRQQMVAAGCLLTEKREDADVICEVRCGALGTDGHSVIYGIPASNALGGVGSLIPGAPAAIPAIPELAFAKREHKSAATKVAIFAYDRVTREPVWQSGIAQAGSNARDTWFMGIGPWQYGTIYRGTRFAGKRIKGTGTEEIRTEFAANQINGVDHREGFLFDPERHLRTAESNVPTNVVPPSSPVLNAVVTPQSQPTETANALHNVGKNTGIQR